MPLAAGSAYVGAWINYSKGHVLGATITLPTQHATVLISVLVMLIGWTGIACWELICFTLHHVRSSSRAKDGLFHQQQVLLRNRMPAIDSVLRMSGLALAWKSNTRRSFLRSLPLIGLGILNIALFTAGGVFVSKITSTNSEVLARGKCGFIRGAREDAVWMGGNETERQIGNVLYQAAYTSYREESSYARSCYGTQLDRSTAFCNIYNDPFIPSVRDNNAPCPFAEKACLDGAVSFDTGLVSSEALGINSRAADRIQVRKKMTCAPIAIEKYTTGWTSEQKPGLEYQFEYLPPDDTYKYYDLGPQLSDGGNATEYTWALSNSSLMAQEQAYKLFSGTYNPGSLNNSAFRPIADLDQTDADLTILFLTNKVVYTNPVKDIWFRATTKANASQSLTDVYFPDEPFTAMGCIEQYQFCNGDDNCGPMGPLNDVYRSVPDIGFNKLQLATHELVKNYISFMQLRLILQFLRYELLLANSMVYGGLAISSDLEPDQWKSEMANLHNISLAGWQAHGVLHAAPGNTQLKPGVNLHDFIDEETSPEHLKLCENQKFRSAEYSSISLLGLLIVIILCFTIIILNTIIPHLVKFIQGMWFSGGGVSKRAWIEDDVLQLQRIALEARGLGPWKGRIDAVPVLDSYAEEFQRMTFEGGYIEPVQSHDAGAHQPLNWDAKGQSAGYNQRDI